MKAITSARVPPPCRPARSRLFAMRWLTVAAVLVISACVYRLPIQQGNHLDADTVGQVRAGMTRTQVRYLLGTPMVPGGFESDRWDYDYYLKQRRLQTPQRAHATIYFKDELVERVVSDIKSDSAQPIDRRPVSAPGA